MFHELAACADWLDSHGLHKEADQIMQAMSRCASVSQRIAITGDFSGTQLLRDVGQGAASGAAGGATMGAIGGAVAGAGVGAAPGAAAGAVGGAITGGLFSAANDLGSMWWYKTRSDVDKASWQAGDVQEKLDTIGNIAQKSADPRIQSMGGDIKTYGIQYKSFIDGYVQKKPGVDLSNNAFQSSASPVQSNAPATPPPVSTSDTPADAMTPTSSMSMSGTRQAQESRQPARDHAGLVSDLKSGVGGLATQAAMYGGAETAANRAVLRGLAGPAAKANMEQSLIAKISRDLTLQAQKSGKSFTPQSFADEIYQHFTRAGGTLAPNEVAQHVDALHAADTNWLGRGQSAAGAAENTMLGDVGQSALRQIEKPTFLKNLGQGVAHGGAGFAASLAADGAINYGAEKAEAALAGSDRQLIQNHMADIKNQIVTVNGLTKNDPKVVAAGNTIWTALNNLLRALTTAAV